MNNDFNFKIFDTLMFDTFAVSWKKKKKLSDRNIIDQIMRNQRYEKNNVICHIMSVKVIIHLPYLLSFEFRSKLIFLN